MKQLVIMLIASVLSAISFAQDTPSSVPLYAARLSNLDDKPISLSQYKGKPLVVNFWATWCAPCRAEIPELNRFHARHKNQIEVLGIGIEDSAESARTFARQHAMVYPVFVAKEQGIPLMRALGNTKGALPYTLFIDRNGQIIQVKLGLLKKSDLSDNEARLLKN